MNHRILVLQYLSRRTVSTLTHSGPGRPKYEIPEEHLTLF